MTVSILTYHSVAPRPSQTLPQLAVTPAQFAEHMQLLRERGIELIAFADVPQALADGRTAVAVTIDDGLADGAWHACPVLAGLDIPATLFLPTAYIGDRARWLPGPNGRRAMLTWPAVRELADAGFEIGSHGARHLAADVNDPRRVHDDALASRIALEDGIGRLVQSFAYPFGYHSAAARRAIRDAGFAQAAAVGDLPAGRDDDRFALPRLQVGPQTDTDALAAMITWQPGAPRRAWANSKQTAWRLGRRLNGWGPAEAARVSEVVE